MEGFLDRGVERVDSHGKLIPSNRHVNASRRFASRGEAFRHGGIDLALNDVLKLFLHQIVEGS